jgi:hypothetical protein
MKIARIIRLIGTNFAESFLSRSYIIDYRYGLARTKNQIIFHSFLPFSFVIREGLFSEYLLLPGGKVYYRIEPDIEPQDTTEEEMSPHCCYL